MNTELEATFLDVDSESLRRTLTQAGAKLVYSERLMKRKVFDYSDSRLQKSGAWIRVRDEGEKVTMSFKQLVNRELDGTKEVCLTVDNFNNACEFLTAAGFLAKSFQETKREKWLLDDVEITLDTWPWIPTFVEIEGENEEKLREAVNNLNFKWDHALFGSVENVYQAYYDVTEEEIDNLPEMFFSEVPSWLEAKRKTH